MCTLGHMFAEGTFMLVTRGVKMGWASGEPGVLEGSGRDKYHGVCCGDVSCTLHG